MVANNMLPIAPLPDPALSLSASAPGCSFDTWKVVGEPCLDQAPSHREVIVIFRETQETMEMVGKNTHRIQGKRVIRLCYAKRLAKRTDVA
jgi:hypothetical protein